MAGENDYEWRHVELSYKTFFIRMDFAIFDEFIIGMRNLYSGVDVN
jgi:hypothetical protein